MFIPVRLCGKNNATNKINKTAKYTACSTVFLDKKVDVGCIGDCSGKLRKILVKRALRIQKMSFHVLTRCQKRDAITGSDKVLICSNPG